MKNKGFALIEGLLTLVIIGLLGGVGWYVYNARNNTSDTFNNADSANSSTAKYAKKDALKKDPYAGWKEYCSEQEKGCFKYPADWTGVVAETVAPAGSGGDGYQITSPGGTVMKWSSIISGIGGGCDKDVDPHVYIHKVEEVTGVKGLYAVAVGDVNAINHVGLIDKINGLAPKTGDTGDCILYTIFKSKDGTRDVQLHTTNINAYKAAEHDLDMKILTSYHY